MSKYDAIHKPETQRIALSSEKDRATTPLTRTQIIVKFGQVDFEICERTDTQTDRHAHRSNRIIARLVNFHKCSEVMVGKLGNLGPANGSQGPSCDANVNKLLNCMACRHLVSTSALKAKFH